MKNRFTAKRETKKQNDILVQVPAKNRHDRPGDNSPGDFGECGEPQSDRGANQKAAEEREEQQEPQTFRKDKVHEALHD